MDRIKTNEERHAALVPLDVARCECGRPLPRSAVSDGCPLCLRCQDPHTAALLDAARAVA